MNVRVQESALRSRHITIVKKGWLSKGADSNQDASIVSFTRVSVYFVCAMSPIVIDVCNDYADGVDNQ